MKYDPGHCTVPEQPVISFVVLATLRFGYAHRFELNPVTTSPFLPARKCTRSDRKNETVFSISSLF